MSWDRRLDSFYLTVTSDANEELFPGNTPSVFTVQLKQTTILQPETWQVGLASIIYPYEFNTLGEKNVFAFSYHRQSAVINLPDWHCENQKGLVDFINEAVNEAIETFDDVSHFPGEAGKRPVTIDLDPMKRVRIRSASPDFDFGASTRVLEILGLEKKWGFKKFSMRSTLYKLLFSLHTLKQPKEKFEEGKNGKFFIKGLLNLRETMKTINPLDFEQEDKIELLTEITGESLLMFILKSSPDLFRMYRYSGNVLPTDWLSMTPLGDIMVESDFEEFKTKVAEFNNVPLMSESSPDYVKTILMFTLRSLLEMPLGEPVFSKHSGVINHNELLFIYSNAVRQEPLNGIMSPILDIVKTEGTPGTLTQYRPNNIQYKRLEATDITKVNFLIASQDGEPAPFKRGPTIIVLHFRRNPQTNISL